MTASVPSLRLVSSFDDDYHPPQAAFVAQTDRPPRRGPDYQPRPSDRQRQAPPRYEHKYEDSRSRPTSRNESRIHGSPPPDETLERPQKSFSPSWPATRLEMLRQQSPAVLLRTAPSPTLLLQCMSPVNQILIRSITSTPFMPVPASKPTKKALVNTTVPRPLTYPLTRTTSNPSRVRGGNSYVKIQDPSSGSRGVCGSLRFDPEAVLESCRTSWTGPASPSRIRHGA